jgi:hypothetical protein
MEIQDLEMKCNSLVQASVIMFGDAFLLLCLLTTG